MQFGNWTINDEGIAYSGDASNNFIAPKQGLDSITAPDAGKPPMYDWVLRATDEEWLSHDDLYDFNYAFVYAMAKYGLSFDYSIFDDTLAEQYDQFDLEDDE